MGKTVNIGGRIHNPEVGNVVAGANEILDDTKGKKQNVINSEVDTALAGLDSGKQDKLTFDQTPTESSTNPVTSGGVYAADQVLQQAIEAILLLIPSAASALNQLADKSFVNSSIATASATFRGTYNLVSDLHLSVSASHQDIATALASVVATADNNDYCFVQVPTSDTSSDIRVTERYKFNGTAWQYEYDLNNSGFTAQQWAAINSTITSALVGKLSALPTADELAALLAGKQATLTFDSTPTPGSANPVTSGGLYDKFEAIIAKIPSDASANNKLVAENRLAAYVGGIIGALDATFDLTSTDGHVTLKITQTDGLIASVQVLTSDIASAAQVSQNTSDIATLQDLYNALQQSAPEIIQPTDTWPVANPSDTVIYRVIDRVNTPPEYYSDYMWNGTAMVLMATYNNAIDPRPKKGSANLVTSGGVFDNIGALDISELNASGGTLASYATLDAAIAAIPSDYQKGGMSIKFVSSVDNKYVQYRLMAQSFTTDETQWQGVDKQPQKNSPNLIDSNGVYNALLPMAPIVEKTKDWHYEYIFDGTANSIATLNTPVILSQDGDSFEVEVSTTLYDAVSYLSFSNSGLANKPYALAFNKTYIGLRDAEGVDGNWLVVAKAYGITANKYKVKIEYADSKICIYVNNTLVSTINSQSTVQIGSLGNGGNGTYGYWRGTIYSIKWNNNPIELRYDATLGSGVTVVNNNSFVTKEDIEKYQYPKGVLSYHDEIFFFYSRYKDTPYYVRYTIQKTNGTDDLTYQVLWLLKKAELFEYTDEGFVFLNKELVDDAESEFVIHEYGKKDYTGGYHGDERIDIDPSSFVRFFADGKVVSPNDNGGNDFTLLCEEFCYMQSSSMHETTEVVGQFVPGHPIIAYHFKKNTFSNGGYHVENMIQFTSERRVVFITAGICCIDKDTASDVYIPDNILLQNLTGDNTEYEASDIHATKVEMWHPSNKLRVTVDSHFKEGITDEEIGKPTFIWDRSFDTKYYRTFQGDKIFEEGEVVRGEMKVDFFIGKQNLT